MCGADSGRFCSGRGGDSARVSIPNPAPDSPYPYSVFGASACGRSASSRLLRKSVPRTRVETPRGTMGRESRTISVLEGDWERWKDLAWAARLSLSEFVRKAVEAYSEQEAREGAPERRARKVAPAGARDRHGDDAPPVRRPDTAPPPQVVREAEQGIASVSSGQPVDTTPAGWTRLPLDSQSTPTERAFQPVTKEAQTRRRKK